jgi:site-specific recombinase XerD
MKDCPWVFPNPHTGKPFVSVYYSWNTARTKAGLRDVRMHDLRHSFASALVNRGMTLYDVKELLGHASITTTQRYAHLAPSRLMTAASEAAALYDLPAFQPLDMGPNGRKTGTTGG